ncbi:HAUS augmin-like complex subunit 1 [Athene cunicularia]|uniref:HAUS augmin-like complex subunit 1 n=1 Tax=Athene cunicularia TaxID=194338 RepID=UPI000EF73E05|nr:HAUS augmin-like complex subunit 1 [Athene cunicularia]
MVEMWKGEEELEECEEQQQEGGQEEQGKGQQQDQNPDPEAVAVSVEEKLGRLTTWLEKIHGDEAVPVFEVDTQTVDILYDLAECSEARDRDVSLLIETMKHKATEYDNETKYFQDVLLEALDISPINLSEEGTNNLNVLVDSAVILKTKDTSLASFFCAINAMSSELHATKLKNKKIQWKLRRLGTKLTEMLMLEKKLNEDLKNVNELLEADKAGDDSVSQDALFMKKKCCHLELEINDAQKQLATRALDQAETHESLVNLSKDVTLMQDEVTALKKELDFYLDLTPNSYFVDKKIEEVKKELDAAEAEFSKEIEMLSLQLPKPGRIFH